MPKKVVFLREKIVNASFEVFKRNGIDHVTARSVAKELKASPAPIYSHFTSIDELKETLIEKAVLLFKDYLEKFKSDLIFLNIGMGFCVFAREEKQLFSSIFLRDSSKSVVFEIFSEIIKNEIQSDDRFKVMNVEDKKKLFLDCYIFILGLSTTIINNVIKNPTDDYIKEKLLNNPGVIINERLKKNNL